MVPEKKSPNNPKIRIIQFQIITVWLWYICCGCILCINQPLHRKKDYQSHFFLTNNPTNKTKIVSTTSSKIKVKDTICLTISDGLWRSIRRLWILISNLSQVLEPSPQGVLRVVIFRYFVGIRTGPFTLSFLSLAPRIRSAHT